MEVQQRYEHCLQFVIYRNTVELTSCFFSGQMSEDKKQTAFGTAIYRLHSSRALLDDVDFDFED
jgi:hypothetical protein